MEWSQLQEEAREAAFKGNAAKLRACLSKGSTIDYRIYIKALENGDVETFQVILDAGGDIDYTMSYSGSSLISTLRHNHQALLEFLFSHGVDPNQGTWSQWLPLISVAVRYNRDIKWVKVMLEKGAKIKGTGSLHVAAIMGDIERMKLLIEYGADLTEIPFLQVIAFVDYRREGTPLHWAIAGGHVEAVKLLLDSRANPSAPDAEGIFASDCLSRFEKGRNL